CLPPARQPPHLPGSPVLPAESAATVPPGVRGWRFPDGEPARTVLGFSRWRGLVERTAIAHTGPDRLLRHDAAAELPAQARRPRASAPLHKGTRRHGQRLAAGQAARLLEVGDDRRTRLRYPPGIRSLSPGLSLCRDRRPALRWRPRFHGDSAQAGA